MLTLASHAPVRRSVLVLTLAAGGLAAAAPAVAATDLLAFTRGASQRQGTFEVAGVAWTCGGELCSAKGPEDAALWPGLCAAFVREAGAVGAFGTPKNRFDAPALALCNETGAAQRATLSSPTPAPPPAAPAPPPVATAASPPSEAAAPAAPAPEAKAPQDAGGELRCDGRDDDGDGAVDEGLRLRAWEDRDRDLFGDPRRSREVCFPELAPGLVVNDYDCDDSDPRRNPGRDNC